MVMLIKSNILNNSLQFYNYCSDDMSDDDCNDCSSNTYNNSYECLENSSNEYD